MKNIFKKLQKINLIESLRLQAFRKSLIFSLAVAAIFFLNVILSPISARIDFSKGRAYTLSSASKKVLQNNSKKTTITLYASSDLPTQLIPLKSEVTDLLKEYSRQGKNIEVKTVDPKADQKVATKMQELGIPELQFSQLQQDKYAITSSYFGIGIEQDGKSEIIPQVAEISNLEYNLTSAIYKINQKNIPKIGVIGFGEQLDPSQDPIGGFKEIVSRQYQVETINLATESGKTEIKPEEYRAVLLFQNNFAPFTSFELDILKKYLEKKGNLIVFADGVTISETMSAVPNENNINQLTQPYGIVINQNLILSTASEIVNFGTDVQDMNAFYPFWLKSNTFNQKFAFFSNVAQLTYPWTSSLELQSSKQATVDYLVKTTPRSWQQKAAFTLNPQQIPVPQQKDLRSFIVAAQATRKQGGSLIVIPSSRFLLNRFYSRTSNNFEFMVNILSQVASQGALSGIRQRAVNYYPLPGNLSEQSKQFFKYLNILLLPGLLSLYGIYRIGKRK